MGNGVGGSRRLLELQQRGAERFDAIARFFDEFADEDGVSIGFMTSTAPDPAGRKHIAGQRTTRGEKRHNGVDGDGHTFVTRARSSSPISPTGTRAVPMKHAARSAGQVAGGGSISLGRTA